MQSCMHVALTCILEFHRLTVELKDASQGYVHATSHSWRFFLNFLQNYFQITESPSPPPRASSPQPSPLAVPLAPSSPAISIPSWHSMPPPPNPVHSTPQPSTTNPLEEAITLDLDMDPDRATAVIETEREITMEEVLSQCFPKEPARITKREMTLDEAIAHIQQDQAVGEDEEDEEDEDESLNLALSFDEVPQYPPEYVSAAVSLKLDESLASIEEKMPKKNEEEPKSAEELQEELMAKLSAHWITGHTQIAKARVIDAKKKEEKAKEEERRKIRAEKKLQKEVAARIKQEEQEKKAKEKEEKKLKKEEEKKAKAEAGPSKRKRRQEVVPSLDAAVKRVTRRTRQRPAGPTVRCTSFYTFSNRIPSHKFVLPNASD